MLEAKIRLNAGNLSDIGKVRETNQDYYGKYEGQFGTLFIVCDGMGGHAGGDIASRLAVEKIREYFFQLTSPLSHSLGETMAGSIEHAHQQIMDYARKHPEKTGMGTTVVMLLIQGDSWWIAHVGDSRIYLKRGEELSQLTKDHSVVQRMVDEGILSAEQARGHPMSNRITKALGSEDHDPDVSGPNPLYKDDTFLLCSDGLHQYFDEQELLEALAGEPQAVCQQLVETAKQRGGSDNITLQIVKAVEGTAAIIPVKKKSGYRRVLPLAAMFCLVLGGIMIIPRLFKEKPIDPVTPPDKVDPITKPDDEFQGYAGFVAGLTVSNQLDPVKLRFFTQSLPNNDKVIYLDPGNQINLQNPKDLRQKLLMLQLSPTSKDVKALLVLAVAMSTQRGQNGDPASVDGDLPKDPLIKEAQEILAKYIAKSSNGSLTAEEFQKSIQALKPHLRFGKGSISLVKEEQVEPAKETATVKPAPTPSRKDGPSIQPGKEKGHVKDTKKETLLEPKVEQPPVVVPPKNTDKPDTLNNGTGDKDATQS